MTFYDSSAAQLGLAHRSLEDDFALVKRQNDSGALETVVYTTTVVLETAVATSTAVPDASGSFSPIKAIETVTEAITSTILVSPSTTAAISAKSSPSAEPSPSVTISSSAASSTIPTSSSNLPPISPAFPTQSALSSASVTQTPQPGTNNIAQGEQSSAPVPSSSGPLPAGAIAGIVIGAIVLLNLLGVLIYRRHQLKKRKLRRATWKAGIRAKSGDFAALEKGIEPPAALSPFMLGMPGSGNTTSSSTHENRHSIYNLPSALARSPSAAFPRDNFMPSRDRSASPSRRSPNNIPVRPARSERRPTRKSPPPVDEALSSAQALATPAAAQVPTALVRVTFIPTRPDELSISIGQTLALLHRFDDGWALCANAYGEQGMVPLECLEGAGGQFAGFKDRSAMMRGSTKRASSLYPPTGTSTRFAHLK